MTCLLLFSCEKSEEDQEVVFPLDLKIISVNQKTAVRVFTNQGEITDAKIKARYASEAVFNDYLNQSIDANAKITFLSRDNVLMGSSKFTVERNDKLFLFYSEQSIINQDSDMGIQVLDILSYSSPKTPVVGGYSLKETRVARGDYNEMQLSGLSYLLNQGDRIHSWKSQSGTLFNEFNESSISLLGAQDTLAVQELVIDLKK